MSRFGEQQENTAVVEGGAESKFSVRRLATFVGLLGGVGKEYGKKYETALSEAIS